MTRSLPTIGFLILVLLGLGKAVAADPGRDTIGKLTVRVYFGTDGDPSVTGDKAVEVPEETADKLKSQEQLEFAHYRELGHDTKPVYRSYENWAQPIQGSDEILCRFEVQKRLEAESIRLDLELWLSRKKVLKSGVLLAVGKPMLVLGPEWRGGRLIISVEMEPRSAS
ncbi:MAG: hypothetical protein ACPG4K_14095 [Haloferula sp.]